MEVFSSGWKQVSRSLLASAFAVATILTGVQSAVSHEVKVKPKDAYPQIFKTVPTGTPTDRPGRGLQWLCIDAITAFNGGQAPVFQAQDTPWVHGLEVHLDEIPYVDGKVKWKYRFKTITSQTTRRFIGNGLPKHVTGQFPVQPGTAAYPYYNGAFVPAPYYTADKIPITPYDLDITIPRSPVYHAEPICISDLVSGIATQTGVIWHANIAIGNGWADPIAALPVDVCSGHPFQDQYHYHGWSWKCFPHQGDPKKHSPLFGYALDGFGIYGPRGEDGRNVTNADLDECHGHFGVVKWEGHNRYMYHYHLNGEYPYGPGCLKGRPLAGVNDAMMKKFAIHKDAEGNLAVH